MSERDEKLKLAENAINRATQDWSDEHGAGNWNVTPMSEAEYSAIVECIIECIGREA
jgi:hypothetical protein